MIVCVNQCDFLDMVESVSVSLIDALFMRNKENSRDSRDVVPQLTLFLPRVLCHVVWCSLVMCVT